MSNKPFQQTTRALENGGRGGRVIVSLVVALAVAWFAWFAFASLSLTAISQTARLESFQNVHTISSPVEARVSALHVALNTEVSEGQLLLTLEGNDQSNLLEQKQSELTASEERLESLREMVRINERLVTVLENEIAEAERQSVLREQEQSAIVALAQSDRERSARLWQSRHIEESRYLRDVNAAEQAEFAAAATVSAARQEVIARRRELLEQERELALNRLEVEALEAGLETEALEVSRLSLQLAERSLRAPVDGRIEHLENLRPGSVVSVGDKVLSIVPADSLRVTAFFDARLLALLKPGQRAKMELAGHPWTSFGFLDLELAAVGAEDRNGLIEVQFHVIDQQSFPVAVQHGVQGLVRIEVRRAKPWERVLQMVTASDPVAAW